VISDAKGRLLWCGATRPGRMHDVTALRTEGIEDLLRRYPTVRIRVDSGYQGLARDFGDQVTAPPKKPPKDATDTQRGEYETASKPSPHNGSASNTPSPSTQATVTNHPTPNPTGKYTQALIVHTLVSTRAASARSSLDRQPSMQPIDGAVHHSGVRQEWRALKTERDEQFQKFVLTQRVGLLRTASLLTAGDGHLAEDLGQSTLTKLYVAWPAFQRAHNPACRTGRAPSRTATTSAMG
jgi:hypothetical protein